MELTESQANFVVALTIALFIWLIHRGSEVKRVNVHTIIAGLKPYYPCQVTSSSYTGYSYAKVVEITIQGPPQLRILYLCPDLVEPRGIHFSQTRFVTEIEISHAKFESEIIRLYSESGIQLTSQNIVYPNEKSPREVQIIFPEIITDIPKLKKILDVISKINE